MLGAGKNKAAADPGDLSASLAAGGRETGYGYVIVLAGFLIMSSVWGLVQSYGVFLKPIAQEFSWSRGAVSGAFSVFMVLLGMLYILAGKLTDRFGPRIVVSVCAVLFGVGHIMMGRIGEVWQLYLIYGTMVAAGSSGSYVPLAATVARWFVLKRGLMTGLVVSGIGAGTVAGPPFIGWLIGRNGWRSTYETLGIITGVIILISAQFLVRDPAKVGRVPHGHSRPNPAAASTGQEMTARQVTATRKFRLLCLMYMMCGLAPWSVTVHIVAHATDIGLSPLAAANILTAIGASNLVGRIGVGGIADRFGSKLAIVFSFLAMLGALLWLQASTELWMFILFGAFFGFGWGGAGVSMSPMMAEFFGLRSLGVVVAISNSFWLGGGAIGALMAGAIYDATESYRAAFLVSATLVTLGLALAISIRRSSRAS